MKLEDFNNLSDEEKSSYLAGVESDQKTITDLTAERDSFKSENDSFRKQLETANTELKATKDMNFTLARKINTEPKKDPETQLHDLIKEFRNGY